MKACNFIFQCKKFFLLILFTVISFVSLAANDPDKTVNKRAETVLTEEEIADSFFTESLLPVSLASDYQVYDCNDVLVFSGSEKEWENPGSRSLLLIKRNSEFFFESNGIKVFRTSFKN